MPKAPITESEILELFYARLQGARKMTPPGSTEEMRAKFLRKALSVSGITRVVARDVLDVPADWWWCSELRVWLPPVEKLPPLEGVLAEL
jgi:hypothetical protein